MRANVKTLSESLKSAIEFTLETFYQPPSASELAKKFLASLPSMTSEDAHLKARSDVAYFALQNNLEFWLSLENLPHEIWNKRGLSRKPKRTCGWLEKGRKYSLAMYLPYQV